VDPARSHENNSLNFFLFYSEWGLDSQNEVEDNRGVIYESQKYAIFNLFFRLEIYANIYENYFIEYTVNDYTFLDHRKGKYPTSSK